jgi:gliding motility-associated-like protein
MRNKLQKSVTTSSKLQAKFTTKNRCLAVAFAFVFFLFISEKGLAQVNESFESGIPATWTLFGNGIANQSWSATTDGYLGTSGVSINPSADNIGDQNTAQYFLVTPQFPVPANGEIQFYTKQTNEADNGAQYEIRLSTAAQPDINGFNIVLQSYTESNLNLGLQTEYEKKVVELPTSIPAGLNIYVAFVAVNTQNGSSPTGDEWFVDEVSILEGCTEVPDDSVVIENIAVNSAEITWSHPTATNFEIQIIPTGGIPADSGIPVTGTSYDLLNLDPETEFDIYIAAICDNDTRSTFSGPYTFETLKLGLSCDFPIVVPDVTTTPFIFADDLSNWANPNVNYTTQGSNCVPASDTVNYLQGDKVFFTYTPTQDGLLTLTQTTFDGGDASNNCFNALSSLFVYDSCANVGVDCLGGITTTEGFDPKTISNLFVQAGQTYVIVVSTLFNSGAGLCFELEITSPVCAPPGDFTFNNLTENSVAYTWDNVGGFSDSWEYVVLPSGSGEPTGSGVPTNTNINNVINTGLLPGTTYDLYVRSVCNGMPGIWSDPTTFTTQCTTFSVPFFTDFNNATNENPEPCWTTIDVNGDDNSWNFIGGWATVQTSLSRFENFDIYSSPRVNFDGTPKRIRYKHSSIQGNSTYTVKLSTTGVGLDDFTTVVLPPTTINNTNFQEIIVDLPENITGDVNIAWIVEPNTTENAVRVSIDDVYIEDKPTCPDPLNPFVLQITENSAWLFWTPGDEETEWEVVIQDLDSGLPTEPGVLTSNNFPFIVENLDSGNRYEFYVRAVCAPDDQSQWVGPVSFTTLCSSYDTPFFESFNDEDENTQKFCWETIDSNGDGITWNINDTYATVQTASFNPPTSFNDYLISPAINLIGQKELKFDVRADFSIFASATRFGLEVLMSTTNTNPNSFSVISPLEIFTNSSYEERSVIVDGNGIVYFAFRIPPQFTGPYSDISIDNVSINDAPLCPNPSNLVVNTTTVDTADLSWSPGFEETEWDIVVQPVDSGIPTGPGITITTTSYTATDLLPDTEYEYYVRSNCGDENSEWIGPITFRTLCTAFTSPFVETFNTGSTSENCWQIVNNNSDIYNWELNSAVFPFEGDQAAAIATTTNGNSDDWLISPTITISENQRLRFYYRATNEFYTEDLEVLLSTNGTGLDQFTTVLYDSNSDPIVFNNIEYREKIVNFPAGISGDINIAFHVPFFPPSPEGFRGLSLFLDNVNIEDRPECAEPSNITINNITDTQAQVSWDVNGSEAQWEISVQPEGTAAPEGNTDPSYLVNASSNPFTITGLSPSTSYDVYVRAICDNSESEWSEAEALLTRCSFENLCQYTFILTSDFDIATSLDITQNNQLAQSVPFNGEQGEEFTVFLCSGVEFSVFFSTLGSAQNQYENFQFDILNDQGDTVYSSPFNIPLRTTVYEGFASCGQIACPEPTNLTINDLSVFSWSPGGGETQWEVAIQPIENGTIPQSGTLVSTNSYTPSASDFTDPLAITYEYFVRAVCGQDDESFWSGPFEFVRNDDVSNAITLPINQDNSCNLSASEVSFLGASVSNESISCDGLNAGDIWFDFTAESLVHIIEVSGFTGEFYYSNGDIPYPEITLTLYKDNGGSLQEIACTYDKVMVTAYTSELIVGDNYKLRLTLNSSAPNDRRFNVCIKTPSDLCFVETVNGGFEEPALDYLSGVLSISRMQVVPGWRTNLTTWNEGAIFIWEGLVAPGFEPYEGSQCVQLLTDLDDPTDPNDPDIKGYYRDFDTSEITLFDFSFAHLGRAAGNTVQLFAGPPGGPYTMVNENEAVVQAWTLVTGEYQVPQGQSTTRFIFRAGNDNDIGNVIDAVSFLPNNEIITEPFTVDCVNVNADIEANGVGTWIPSETNPGVVTLTDANSNTTSITGFVQPGIYTFTWQTRYCSYDLEITYNGVADIPTVESPVEYCLNDTAEQLTATVSNDYTLVWFTQPTGGTASIIAPTPDTSSVGSTSYYVAFENSEGCIGARAEILVNVAESFTPELTFSYDDSCVIASVNPIPTLSDEFETGGVFSSATLIVDTITGEIDITSASVGLHDVTYTFDGDTDNCIAAGVFTSTIEFTAASLPVTDFSYTSSPFCLLNGTNALPDLASGFTSGGIFASETLSVNSNSGEIDLTSGTTGMHDITYTFDEDPDNCIQAGTFTTSIEIIETLIPETNFTYPQDQICTDSSNTLPDLAANFNTVGTFTSETGLTINSDSGEINPSTSLPGVYTITYTILEDLTNCLQGASSTVSIEIIETTTPVTTFDYGSEPFCVLTGDSVFPNLAPGFTSGGSFSSTTVTVDSTTGEIDLTSASTGMHDVVYTFEEDSLNCVSSGTHTTTIEVLELISTNTDFTYSFDIFCADSATILPDLGTNFTLGGVFTAETGLSLNGTTGEINVAASSSGIYTVQYEIVEDTMNCLEGSLSSFEITILDSIDVEIEDSCIDGEYLLIASLVNTSLNSDEVIYTWSDVNGNVVGDNSEVFNVTQFASNNSNISEPIQFSVTINYGACSSLSTFTAEQIECQEKLIPKGISPDGNGKNDTFDLTGLGVTHMYIYNRYGKEVFSFKGNYTNQWYGQSKTGNNLPDGTYFYNILKQDGSTATGWVFINRAQ